MKKERQELSELDDYIVRVQKSTRTLLPFMQIPHERLRLKCSWYYRWHTNPVISKMHWLILSTYVAAIFLLIFSSFTPALIHASTTKTWDFGTAAEYTYDDTKIEFSGGAAQLKGTYSPGVDWIAAESGSNWGYRQPITLNNSGSEKTNYPVKVSMPAEAESALYWNLNEDEGGSLADSSGNSITGTATGTTVVPAQYDDGRSFASGDVIDSGIVSQSTQSYSALTLSARVKLSDTVSSQHLVGRQTGTTEYNTAGGFGIDFGAANAGHFTFHFHNGVDNRLSFNSAPSVDTWYHLAAVFNPATATMTAYVNGSQTNSSSVSTTAITTLSNAFFRTGKWSTAFPFPFTGSIDEVRIYNQALTAAEISNLSSINETAAGHSLFSSANANGDDIRFTSSDGATQLGYWHESYVAAREGLDTWVELPTFAVGESTIYMYYGNASAAAASNPASITSTITNIATSGTASSSADLSSLYDSNNVIDGNTTDGGSCATADRYWLLPNATTGWVQVDLGSVLSIEKVRWMNTRNAACNDRATTAYRVQVSETGAFSGEETQIASGTMAFSVNPDFVTDTQSVQARYVRFYVDAYSGSGGGLTELEVYKYAYSVSVPTSGEQTIAYPTDNPTVVPNTGRNYVTVGGFAETLGAGSTGNVKYQISADSGSTWYWYTGGVWAVATGGYAESNTAAEVNSNIAAFTVGSDTRTFKFRAYLNSDGSQRPKLDSIQLTYAYYPDDPSGVSIGAVTTTGFTGSWTDNSDDETGFKIYVSTIANADCSLATYSGTPDYTTAAGATSQAVTSKSVNTRYCLKVVATNAIGDSGAAYSLPAYTLANAPGVPTTTSGVAPTLNVIIAENGNSASTEYAFGLDQDSNGAVDADGFVQANGTLGASAVWQTYEQWGGLTGRNTTLSPNAAYSFIAKARNGGSTQTAYSSASASTYTYANVPAAPTVTAVDSGTLNIVINVNSNPSATEFAIYNETLSQYIQANGTLGASAVWQTKTNWGGASGVNNPGLTENTSYVYKVKARNANEVETSLSTGTTRATPLSPSPPASVTLKDISDTSNVNRYQFSLQWSAVENAGLDYYLVERKATGEDDFSQIHQTSNGSTRYYLDTGLDSAKTYTYRIKSHTELPDTSAASSTVSATPGQSPSISSVTKGTAGSDSITITWTTDIAADSVVEYGPDQNYGSKQGSTTLATSHSVVLQNLTPDTTYNFRVTSTDVANRSSASSNSTFATAAEVYPEISGVSSGTPGMTTATIVWTTDIDADSTVEYGPTSLYGLLAGSSTERTSHSVTITGLDIGVLYHYRVKSKGSNGNTAASQDYTFTTSLLQADVSASVALSLSNVAAEPSASSAGKVTVVWDSNKASSSQVFYGITTSLGGQTDEETALTLRHYVVLSNLTPATTYYYQVRSIDASGNLANSEIQSFTVADLPTVSLPAAISAVEVTDITLNSAIVSWKTSTVSTSTINLGTSTAYSTTLEDKSTGSTTVHTVRVTDLSQGTQYHFRIKGRTVDNKDIASDDYVFSTQTMPEISAIQVKDITAKGATITWKTNVSADSFVDFGPGTVPGGGLSPVLQSQGRSEEVSDHAVTLVGLNPAAEYQFRVKSRDKYTNLAVSSTQSFTTTVDVNPPVIKDLKVETSITTDVNGSSKAQAIVSWGTDEPSTAQVQYSTGIAVGNNYQDSTPEDVNLSTSHIAVISNLLPSTTYHMRVISKDAAGNIAASDDYTVLTLKQETTLLQYILQVLEEKFFWVKGLGLAGE